MRQCRGLSQLGRQFAPLWQIDPETCSATAPLSNARFTFQPASDDNLTLTIHPAEPPENAPALRLGLAVNGISLGAETSAWIADAWVLSLGAAAPASERLSQGMFLEARSDGGAGGPLYRLPLLGSARAMRALTDCASIED